MDVCCGMKEDGCRWLDVPLLDDGCCGMEKSMLDDRYEEMELLFLLMLTAGYWVLSSY